MNKKIVPIIIITILVITGFVFVLKYKSIKEAIINAPSLGTSDDKKSAGEKKANEAKTPSSTTMSAAGSVVSIDKDKLVLKITSGEISLKIAPTPPVRMMEKGVKIDKKITDIKKGTMLMARYLKEKNRVIDILIFKL